MHVSSVSATHQRACPQSLLEYRWWKVAPFYQLRPTEYKWPEMWVFWKNVKFINQNYLIIFKFMKCLKNLLVECEHLMTTMVALPHEAVPGRILANHVLDNVLKIENLICLDIFCKCSLLNHLGTHVAGFIDSKDLLERLVKGHSRTYNSEILNLWKFWIQYFFNPKYHKNCETALTKVWIVENVFWW